MPFQGQRITAASSPTSDYEDDYPVQGSGILVNIVGGLIVVVVVAGSGYVATKIQTPKSKVVVVTHPFESSHEGENVFWYGSNDPASVLSEISDYTLSGRPNKNYAYYDLDIVRVEWKRTY